MTTTVTNNENNDQDLMSLLPLAMEGPGGPSPSTANDHNGYGPLSTTTTDATTSSHVSSGSNVVHYRLLMPEAASRELRQRWAELVEPKRLEEDGGAGGGISFGRTGR